MSFFYILDNYECHYFTFQTAWVCFRKVRGIDFLKEGKSKRWNCCKVLNVDALTAGRVIADYRKKKRITQEILSGLCGINRTHLSAIERGLRSPTLTTFIRLCYAMEVDPSEVVVTIEKKLLLR